MSKNKIKLACKCIPHTSWTEDLLQGLANANAPEALLNSARDDVRQLRKIVGRLRAIARSGELVNDFPLDVLETNKYGERIYSGPRDPFHMRRWLDDDRLQVEFYFRADGDEMAMTLDPEDAVALYRALGTFIDAELRGVVDIPPAPRFHPTIKGLLRDLLDEEGPGCIPWRVEAHPQNDMERSLCEEALAKGYVEKTDDDGYAITRAGRDFMGQ